MESTDKRSARYGVLEPREETLGGGPKTDRGRHPQDNGRFF